MLALPRTVPGIAAVDELALPPGRRRRSVVRAVTSLPVLRVHHRACVRIRFAG